MTTAVGVCKSLSGLGEAEESVCPVLVKSFKTGDDYLAFPKSRRPTWHNDPATTKQIAFLLDLGESDNACVGLTKGAASKRIDALFEAQEAAREGRWVHRQMPRGASPVYERHGSGTLIGWIAIGTIVAFFVAKCTGK